MLHEHERERVELAHELHEQVAQSLAVVLLGLDDPALCDASDPHASKIIALREQVAETLEHCTALAVGLRPPVLDHLGLAPALEQLAQRLGVERVSVDPALAQVALGRALETEIFRSVEEALNRLTGRLGLTVTLDPTVRDLRISVRSVDGSTSVGDVGTLEARLALIGGTLSATAGEVRVRIPVGQAP